MILLQLSELLRSQLLTLTAKLHDGELDRHNLQQQLLEANHNCQQLSVACNDALTMATTVEKLQCEVMGTVSRDHLTAHVIPRYNQWYQLNSLMRLIIYCSCHSNDIMNKKMSSATMLITYNNLIRGEHY